MGLKKWFARMGNVGGVARNVSEGWKKIESQSPDMPPKKIAETFTKVRFRLISEYTEINTVGDILSGKINTPLELAWSLLEAENPDELETLMDNKGEWIEIIREEMEKKGLNPDLKW